MSETILVVDDDPTLVNLMKEDLEAEGYSVLVGYDGQMAVQMARTNKPSLIVLDVNMPATSGLKAYEVLHAAGDMRLIPVIFLTGESSQKVPLAAGADARIAYLRKPIDLEEFNSLVRRMLHPTRPS